MKYTKPTVRDTAPVSHGPIRVELYDDLASGGSALARMLWPDGVGGFTTTPDFFLTVHDPFGRNMGQGSNVEGEGDRFEVEYWTDQQRWEVMGGAAGSSKDFCGTDPDNYTGSFLGVDGEVIWGSRITGDQDWFTYNDTTYLGKVTAAGVVQVMWGCRVQYPVFLTPNETFHVRINFERKPDGGAWEVYEICQDGESGEIRSAGPSYNGFQRSMGAIATIDFDVDDEFRFMEGQGGDHNSSATVQHVDFSAHFFRTPQRGVYQIPPA